MKTFLIISNIICLFIIIHLNTHCNYETKRAEYCRKHNEKLIDEVEYLKRNHVNL